ncbi:MAG TPA: hypothetical protein VFH59_07640 [Frateuria sp.]|uniref:hypothetical protein n=1 Tax=Frateuria sp. TaxID=2211372 RepID=UPI002D7F66EC|nr:hypothetical protein [Frateuria sp.]HET6805293.1 hypothetical protein [Frateuria sp.]
MSMGWTIAGTFGQLLLAGLLFMAVVFSAGGVPPARLQLAVLNVSMFVLPALCVLSAGVVAYMHAHGGGASSYWWYAMPLAAALPCVVYVLALGHRSGTG